MKGSDCADTCFNGADRCQDGNAGGRSVTSNANFVLARRLATGRIDDQVNLVIFEHIKDMRPAFGELEEPRDWNTAGGQSCSGSTRGEEFESQVRQLCA